jgi:putative acetyltransferase
VAGDAHPLIREETPGDYEAVDGVLRRAFGSAAEAELVRSLRSGGFARVSLVAAVAANVVGHILLSRLRVISGEDETAALALAPLAVDPLHQRRGIGAALVRAAIDRGGGLGESLVFVLGDPAYYGRFGFSAAAATKFECVYACEAFQALPLGNAVISTAGKIIYPPPFGELGEGVG